MLPVVLKPLYLLKCLVYNDIRKFLCKGCVILKPYTEQEIEQVGFFSSLLGGKPVKNAWAEINNLLVEAESAKDLSAEQVKKAVKSWGAKLDEESVKTRAEIYGKLAEVVYTEADSADYERFQELEHLAKVLELPEYQIKLSNKAAKTVAYFARCRGLLEGTEKLDIKAIDKLFGYDYEDGLAARKQVFQDYFYQEFEGISQRRRYSDEDIEKYSKDCEKLDIPYEFRNNIQLALDHYNQLWMAETQPLPETPIDMPLQPGEVCRAYANCGFIELKEIETVDNYYEMTRKFKLDETVTFSGDKLDMPKSKEETNVVTEIGYFFLTNQRIFGLAKESARIIDLQEVTGLDFDGSTTITYHTTKGDVVFKYPDEAADVMYLLVQRVLKEDIKKA